MKCAYNSYNSLCLILYATLYPYAKIIARTNKENNQKILPRKQAQLLVDTPNKQYETSVGELREK